MDKRRKWRSAGVRRRFVFRFQLKRNTNGTVNGTANFLRSNRRNPLYININQSRRREEKKKGVWGCSMRSVDYAYAHAKKLLGGWWRCTPWVSIGGCVAGGFGPKNGTPRLSCCGVIGCSVPEVFRWCSGGVLGAFWRHLLVLVLSNVI